jgi:membrane-associated phospholipid phosphatase
MEIFLDSSIEFIKFLQNLGDWITSIMQFFTWLGLEDFYVLVMPILFWCYDIQLGIRVGLILMLSGISNTYVKWMLHSPRPFWYSKDIIPFSFEASFGAPSGHAQNAVAVWGLLAVKIQKRWAWFIAILMMLLIGFSRMQLGMHFPIDVAMGWILGVLILYLFLRIEAPGKKWLQGRKVPEQIGVMFATAIGLILVAWLIRVVADNFPLPHQWIEAAIRAAPEGESVDPWAISGVITNAASFFGLSAGYILLKQHGGYNPKGTLLEFILRFIVGIIGVVILWMGLGEIFPSGESMIAIVLRFARYTLVSLWVVYIAPWLFIRLKLAKPSS